MLVDEAFFARLSVCDDTACHRSSNLAHHHLFTAYGAEFYRKVVLSSDGEEVQAYLGGEEIDAPADTKGVVAVMISLGDCEISLGGGKVSDGKLKNYYPKGLRTH